MTAMGLGSSISCVQLVIVIGIFQERDVSEALNLGVRQMQTSKVPRYLMKKLMVGGQMDTCVSTNYWAARFEPPLRGAGNTMAP